MRIITLFFFLFPFLGFSQTVCSLESRERFDAVVADLSGKDLSEKSIQELVLEIGKSFIGTPYVEKTLELPGDEKLAINLTGLDCTTYLETVVTLARIAKQGELTFEAYEKELEKLRYQDGVRKDYSSRLHYFSDWIFQNQEKGIVTDITAEIGGTLYPNQPTFMSENPKFYPQLSNPEFVQAIKVDEAAIAKRTYYFIPKTEIQKHEQNIQSGDLIAITTTIKNLDIVHVGFAVEQAGRIHLMHASTGSMKVEISEKPLSEYLAGNRSQSGIMVCRLLE
ncbi:N-acetylmuramoyl-L-alanine amidase-like domain-containing protein [Algoriphagus terrigena]|uniref:N-acetylmuramoyl-L-alanine amidase-like domain-containing protein n=1 Tax=Algoriphagus terrigena TaxID=344884 RepID=UPI0003FB0A7F|nr:N-acetylmuramoyl-L-alanine amidase-like domain-containing protein [Algoriphagus terrigena]